MLADIGAGGGEGVILTDQAHSVGAALLTHQGHVAGDIHPGGTQGDTGYGILEPSQAALVEDVLLVIIPEALQTIQHQPGGIAPDGAVRRIDDAAGGLLNGDQGVHGGCAGEHLLQEHGKLPQADAAGHAFAAALGVAQAQKAQRHIHRAQTRGTGGNTPLHVAIEVFHHGLGPAGRLDIQPAHTESTPCHFCVFVILYILEWHK